MTKRKLNHSAVALDQSATKQHKHNTTTATANQKKRHRPSIDHPTIYNDHIQHTKRYKLNNKPNKHIGNISHTIIHSVYGSSHVYTLRNYLISLYNTNPDDTNPSYQLFLDNTLVVVSDKTHILNQHTVQQTDIQYIIHYVINNVLCNVGTNINPHHQNILSCGWRKLSNGTYGIRHFPLIEHREVNTVHNILLNPFYVQLYQSLQHVNNSYNILINILQYTCMFYCVDDRHNYIQLCGAPVQLLLYETINKRKPPQPMSLNKHREKSRFGPINMDNNSIPPHKLHEFNPRKLNNITISRQSILYAHTPYNQIQSGLSIDHILNRCNDSMNGAQQLFAHIWPDQVKLNKSKSMTSIPGIPSTTPRTPQHYYIDKQYKSLVQLLKHILHKHKSLPYSTLLNKCYSLDHILPSYNTQSSSSNNSMHVNTHNNTDDITGDNESSSPRHTSVDAVTMSQKSLSSSQPLTDSQLNRLNYASQTSSTNAQNASSSCNTSPDKATNKHNNTIQYNQQLQHRLNELTIDQLVQCSVPTHSVHTFIINCLIRVLPRSLLGSTYNMNVLCSTIQHVIELRRYETHTLHQLVHKLQFHHTPTCLQQSGRQHPNSSIKQHGMFHLLIYWLINDYVLQLLKHNFYITDIDACKNTIVYYSKPIWNTVCHYTINNNLLYNNQYTQLSRSDAYQHLFTNQHGYTSLRVRPKRNGLRSIQNMSAASAIHYHSTHKQYHSINQLLRPLFEVLKYEISCNNELCGTAVNGANDIYMKLKSLIVQLRNNKRYSKVYGVTVDMKSCYDSINRDKLYTCIKYVLQHEQYAIQRYTQSYQQNNAHSYRVKNNRYVYERNEIQWFEHVVRNVSQQCQNNIYVDSVIRQYQSNTTLQQLLHTHMYDNIIQFQSKFYLQQNGISQGSIVSTMLCSIYLALIERTSIQPKLNKICSTSRQHVCNTTLLRHVDDYVLLTTCRLKAQLFLQLMTNGFVQYGIHINTNKTQHNINSIDEPNTRNHIKLQWNGYIIDTRSQNITLDYSKSITDNLSDQLTVFYASDKLAYGLNYVYQRYLTQKLSDILIDAAINHQYTIYYNMYELIVYGTYKLIAYYKSLNSINYKLFSSKQSYLCRVLLNGIEYLQKYVANKPYAINPLDMRLLCVYGIQSVLIRYKSHMKIVYDQLTRQLQYKQLLHYIVSSDVHTNHQMITRHKHRIVHRIRQIERNSFIINKLKQI